MRSYKEQIIEPVAASDLLPTVRNMKAEGYRMLQICATKVSEGFEILYSFDKDHELTNLRVTIPEEEEVQSVTGEYWGAFIYENEMHDLFGIKIVNNELDYGGHFFKVAEPTPWNPKN
ncbi:NADH-quinone oxidoreductase subunit C [Anaerovorax odorimutans]|uniref:NADH-quinone oxidoreductase subunit C n=1 Tax=Anaerovorax odorimutans TaxID=109327 RepID=A0ABT1RJW9_9FIRM|nr:NADH-quinone oxidoreductase subunit C [Anaerovorax odorimutans]MCQ4635482.1 NADH-quinone oxidoreductase subunit C [Anaerovorax odorimutans]